jgi:hypothetical protein
LFCFTLALHWTPYIKTRRPTQKLSVNIDPDIRTLAAVSASKCLAAVQTSHMHVVTEPPPSVTLLVTD